MSQFGSVEELYPDARARLERRAARDQAAAIVRRYESTRYSDSSTQVEAIRALSVALGGDLDDLSRVFWSFRADHSVIVSVIVMVADGVPFEWAVRRAGRTVTP